MLSYACNITDVCLTDEEIILLKKGRETLYCIFE